MNPLTLPFHYKNEKWIYIISLVEKSIVFENFLKELYKVKPDTILVFMFKNVSPLQIKCEQFGYRTIHIEYHSRKNILGAFSKIYSLFKKEKPHLIHAHLFDASFVSITLGWFMGIKKRIHTRHHATHHHYYFPHAVKYDKWINKKSTRIIAVSENIKSILVNYEKVDKDKISVVYHGFDFSVFENIPVQRKNRLQQLYAIKDDSFVIGMVSRYTHWKGIQYVIPAFKRLLTEFPNVILVLANSIGDYKSEIKELLNELPSENYREIEFEQDMPALYNLMNVFVHVPIDEQSEAFGQVYIEALAASVPTVFTKSGIASEFIIDKENTLVVNHRNSSEIFVAIKLLLHDKNLCNHLSLNGRTLTKNLFSINSSLMQTFNAYE